MSEFIISKAGALDRREFLKVTGGFLLAFTLEEGGNRAMAQAPAAKSIGWHVTVVDARPAYATAERFPNADAVHCLPPEALLTSPHVVIPPESMVMIMTHRFMHDRDLLRVLLPRAPRYIGVLGPKSRTERQLGELTDEGVAFPEANLARLDGPAGVDIGAETPEETAVSTIGEMQAVLALRDGGALRDRTPIHDPTEQHLTSP